MYHSCIIHLSCIYHSCIIHVSFHILLIYGTYDLFPLKNKRCVSLLRDPPSRVKAPKKNWEAVDEQHPKASWENDKKTSLLHPRKLTCPLKRDYLSRVYIFQPLIFRGHVSFQGSTLPDTNISPLQIDVFFDDSFPF